jgi:hypothetical protein
VGNTVLRGQGLVVQSTEGFLLEALEEVHSLLSRQDPFPGAMWRPQRCTNCKACMLHRGSGGLHAVCSAHG